MGCPATCALAELLRRRRGNPVVIDVIQPTASFIFTSYNARCARPTGCAAPAGRDAAEGRVAYANVGSGLKPSSYGNCADRVVGVGPAPGPPP